MGDWVGYTGRGPHPLQSDTPDSEVPLGARKLGCRNCRRLQRDQHPIMGMLYCASCPVTLRRMAKGKSLLEAAGDTRWLTNKQP